MASTKLKIPTIDFCNSEVKPNTPQWESTKVQVFDALKEFGCFEAIYDKVPNEISKAMFDTSKKAFEFPLSKLLEYRETPYHMFDGPIPMIPLYECTRSADMLLPNSVETFANTFWPDESTNYCNLAKSYYKPLMELDDMVKRMILESLGLEHYYDEFVDSNYYLIRFTQAFPSKNGHKPGLGGHTDGGYLTIIKGDQTGLQVQKNGEWIDCNVSPNSYIVLSADVMMAWTNGTLPSVVHRVSPPEDSDRFSIQLFSSPKLDYHVEAAKELVDKEHPVLFKPFTLLDYHEYVMSGAKNGVGVKYFCGL